MSENNLNILKKKYRKSIEFNEEAVEHILKFLNKRYGKYTVEVDLSSKGIQKFDDINDAIKLADDNEDYLGSITITAQKDTEKFNLKFDNPDENRGATAILDCSSEGKGLYKSGYFFDDLVKTMHNFISFRKAKAFRLSVYCAMMVNIYMSLSDYLNNTLSLTSYFIPAGILAIGYVTDKIISLFTFKAKRIGFHIDDEKIRQKYQGQEWKIQSGMILFLVLFVAVVVIQLLIRWG